MNKLAKHLFLVPLVALGLVGCDSSPPQVTEADDGELLIVEQGHFFQRAKVSAYRDGVLWRVPMPEELQRKTIVCDATIERIRATINVTAVWIANKLHAKAVLRSHVPKGEKPVVQEDWKSYVASNMDGYRAASFNVELLGPSAVRIFAFSFEPGQRTEYVDTAAYSLTHTAPIDPHVFVAATTACDISWLGWSDYPVSLTPEEMAEGTKKQPKT